MVTKAELDRRKKVFKSLEEGAKTFDLLPGGYDTPGEPDTFHGSDKKLPCCSGNQFTLGIVESEEDAAFLFWWDDVPVGILWSSWV